MKFLIRPIGYTPYVNKNYGEIWYDNDCRLRLNLYVTKDKMKVLKDLFPRLVEILTEDFKLHAPVTRRGGNKGFSSIQKVQKQQNVDDLFDRMMEKYPDFKEAIEDSRQRNREYMHDWRKKHIRRCKCGNKISHSSKRCKSCAALQRKK